MASQSPNSVAFGDSKAPAPNFNETLPAPARSTVAAYGDYDVIAELGEGGMGRVYKAVHRNLGRFAAVKVLRSNDPFECSRFRGEAELIATLEHPNIVQIFSVDTTPDGRPYLVLEFAEGGSLDRELGGQPQEPRRAAEMMETLARAVQYAHEKGVIHRDLKPANILRGKDRTLKLTDFGLAKHLEVSSGMTPSNAVMGTPSYMSPEQAEGKVKELGPTTDVYGLGAILYEMLTGRPPFRGVNMVDTLEQVRWAEPAPPTRLAPRLPRDLSTICLKCLQKSPARRYQTAGELAADLRRWLNGETIAARPAPTWERLWRQMRRRPWEAAAVALSVLLVALMIASWVVLQRKEAEANLWNERETARQRQEEREVEFAKDIQKQQEAAAQKLRERGDKALGALGDIRRLLVSGELRTTPGLDDLYRVLIKNDEAFIGELMGDAHADRARLAELAFEVGELADRIGEIDAAEREFARAGRLFAEAESADPPRLKARRGEAELRFATVRYDRGDERGAAAVCDELEPLWRSLRDDPRADRAHATRQLAEVEHLRGMIFARLYQLEKADAAYTRSIDYRQEVDGPLAQRSGAELRELKPAERLRAVYALRGLGRGYGYRGDVRLRRLQVPAADSDYCASHALRVKATEVLPLVAATTEEEAELEVSQFQLARSWMNLADFQTRHRAYTTAKQSALKALALREQLHKENPNNALYRIELASNLTAIAEFTVLEQQGRPKDPKPALDRLDRALAVASKAFLQRQGPVGATFLAREVRNTARALRAELLADTEPARARGDLESVLHFLNDALAKSPDHPTYRYQRGAMSALLAELDHVPADDPRWAGIFADLEVALVKGKFRDKPLEDVRERRAFQKLKDDNRFQKLFNEASR